MLNIQSVLWPSQSHQVVGASPRALNGRSFHQMLEASVEVLRSGGTQGSQPTAATGVVPELLQTAGQAHVALQNLTHMTERAAHTYQQIIDIRI